MSAPKRIKINNSYESEPSSSSSLNEQLEYNEVYDGSMHLPYILKPPSYETEVIIPAEGSYMTSSQENKIPLIAMSGSLPTTYEDQSPASRNKIISPTLSQKSAFKGFSGSPYGKLQREFFPSTDAIPQISNSSKNIVPYTCTEQKTLSNKSTTVFTKFYDMVMDENSCNAVDIQLSNEEPSPIDCHEESQENGVDYLFALSKESETMANNLASKPFRLSIELSFNGKIKSLASPAQVAEHDVAIEIPSQPINYSFILKKYSNEKSPDLFGEDEDDNVDARNENECYFRAEDLIEFVESTGKTDDTNVIEKEANETQEQNELLVDVKAVENSADTIVNKSLNCPTESSFADDQTCELDLQQPQPCIDSYSLFRENCRRERELLRRVRKCLAGIPPPPSVTIPQVDMFSEVISRKQDIFDFMKEIDTCTQDNCSSSTTSTNLFKPTHTVDEAKEMVWRQVLGVRQQGLCFNLCKASENNEYLALSVIERFIGAETATSYQNSPSSAKKRNARLKLLTQSPGNRLSHLARRRATFSSVQLATQKSNSLRGPQILMDAKKKNKHRRKNTPKRMTPGSKKKTRKTPSSSARKRQFRGDLIKLGPSREASKRALFQSPPKQLEHKPPVPRLMPNIKPEIANRVEKSKRALFSPDKQSESTNLFDNLNNLGTQRYSAQHTRFSAHQFDTILKRKRSAIDDDTTGDSTDLPSQSSKLFRGSASDLTPRALKIKSQSFCIGAGSSSTMVVGNAAMSSTKTSANVIVSSRNLVMHKNIGLSSSTSFGETIGLPDVSNAGKIQRAHSEMIAPTNNLTENQRKKLLWAVSQALQEKKITTKHESFKSFAAVLARVVRRIFQEFFQKGSTSNSETLLRLAKRYVHNVITGRCADDIYLQAKTKIVREKNESNCRFNGYIGPEEYQRLKHSQQQQLQEGQTNLFSQNSISNILSIDTSLDSFGFGVTKSQDMTLSSNTIDTIFTTQSQLAESTPSSLKKLPIQPNASLNNSSSKNNMCGLALRENVDFETDQRRSAQKNFTGKDQRNVSPYAHNTNHYLNNNQLMGNIINGASMKCATSVGNSHLQTKNIAIEAGLLHSGNTKVKRQISFDN